MELAAAQDPQAAHEEEGASLCDLQSFRRPSAFTELHRRPDCHLRYRNRLVVAHGSAQ